MVLHHEQQISQRRHSVAEWLLPPRLSSAMAAISGLALALGLSLALYTSILQPEPYMDEIFHVPQACRVLERPWDPETHPLITTPPGLYYVSLVLSGLSCEPVRLRAVSAMYFAGCAFLLTHLLRKRHSQIDASTLALAAVTFPPLLFCAQLFYTDVGALFFLLLAWASTGTNPLLAFVAALTAMFFRQSNLVWIVFIIGERVSFALEQACESKRVWEHDPRRWLPLVRSRETALDILPLALALLGFLAYLRSQGALVMGDKDNHVVSVHFAQLNYLVGVLLTTSPLGWKALVKPREFLVHFAATPRFTAALFLLSLLFVAKFTITHRFILADNRHFSFYVWGRFFNRHWLAKYSLVPLYVACGSHLSASMEPSLQSLGFAAACALSLVPLPLFEPRYFIVPVAFFAVLAGPRLAQDEAGLVWLCIAANGLVGAWVQYMFWYRPFVDAHGQVARFMW